LEAPFSPQPAARVRPRRTMVYQCRGDGRNAQVTVKLVTRGGPGVRAQDSGGGAVTGRSVSRSIRPPLLGLLLVALVGAVATGAAADRVANVTVKLDVNGNHRTCKDLFVGVEVYDSSGHLLASCHWDGGSDAFGTKACEKHFDRTIDSFVVYLTVRYIG